MNQYAKNSENYLKNQQVAKFSLAGHEIREGYPAKLFSNLFFTDR